MTYTLKHTANGVPWISDDNGNPVAIFGAGKIIYADAEKTAAALLALLNNTGGN